MPIDASKRNFWNGTRTALLFAGVALAPLYLAPQAAAQEEVADEETSPFATQDRIVVTARRRDESLQDVPVSLSVYSGEQLELTGIQDITALGQSTPNVTFEVSRGTNSTFTAFIRGVGQQDPVAGFESGVGIYVDDVYFNRPQAAVLDVYDVERIEVLRGPQGTLYGRNTIGGAIKYVSRRLSAEPEARIKVTGGSYGQTDFVGTVSLPVTDELRVGGTIAYFRRDGFGENLFIEGLDNYGKEVLAGRASVEWEPTPDIFIRVAGDYVDDRSPPRQGHRLLPSALDPVGFPVLDNVYDTRAGLNVPDQEVKAYGLSVIAEWQITDNFKLKNIFAWREDETFSPIDFDSLPVDDLDVPVNYENYQLSEEIQLQYGNDYFDAIAGFYYLDANAFNAFDVVLGPTGDLLGLPGLNAFTQGDVDTETWAVFGDVTFDVSSLMGNLTDIGGLEIALGGRYTEDKRTSQVFRQTKIGGISPIFGGTAIPIATTSDFEGSETFDDFSWRASLAWQPVTEHNFYFTFSQGFKGGGFDPRGLTSVAPDIDGDGISGAQGDYDDQFEFLNFEPETLDSYELGWKAILFGGRVNTSLALFYNQYKDVQIPGSIGVDTDGDGVSDTFAGVTTNAAEAEFYGVEFEGNALLHEFDSGGTFSTNWAIGYLSSEFLEYILNGVDVSDDRDIQNTPDWTLFFALNYSQPLTIGDMDGDLALIPSVSYRSESTQFEVPLPIDEDGFALVDASLVWTSEDGRLQLGIHGKNLTDERYIVAGYDFVVASQLGLTDVLTAFYGNPRTVSGTISVQF